MSLLPSFLSYLQIDTQAAANRSACPSSPGQAELLHLLHDELLELGLAPYDDKKGHLYCLVPGNESWPKIGLVAHVDTAEECSGRNVRPQVITGYAGQDIPLGNSGLLLSPAEFPKLKTCLTKTLIVTDGRTLLGGDDKAGVAIIMTAVRKLLLLDPLSRHPCHLLFTSDEEIGRGVHSVDLTRWHPFFAYTIDGGDPRLVAIENFNACRVHLTIEGVVIHPGTAKDRLVNAGSVLVNILSRLPAETVPEKREGREGFHHLIALSGQVASSGADIIFRDFDADGLLRQVDELKKIIEDVRAAFPKAKIALKVEPQYENMLPIIERHPEARLHLEKVYQELSLPFSYQPVRGGTDGAVLSKNGVPCPNLGTGTYNHHGPYEFAVLEEMEQMVDIVSAIIRLPSDGDQPS